MVGMVSVEANGATCDDVTPRDVFFALAGEFEDSMPIPTVSEWGFLVAVLLVLSLGAAVVWGRTAGPTRHRRRRRLSAEHACP